mgnify:CR=1 FL=1
MSEPLIFARLCPPTLANIDNASANQHQIHLAFYQQTLAPGSVGFDGAIKNVTLLSSEFQDTFFNTAILTNPTFTILESKAKMIGFCDGANQAELTSGNLNTGPILTEKGDITGTSIRGINILKKIVRNLEVDMGNVKSALWDACSYSNLINRLQNLTRLYDLTNSDYSNKNSSSLCCSMTLAELALELAKIYDSRHDHTPTFTYTGTITNVTQTGSTTTYVVTITGLTNELKIGDVVTIAGTTNFNGACLVTAVSGTGTFDFVHANSSDATETGITATATAGAAQPEYYNNIGTNAKTAYDKVLAKYNGLSTDEVAHVALSVLFKHQTSGVKNVELIINMKLQGSDTTQTFVDMVNDNGAFEGQLAEDDQFAPFGEESTYS